MKMIVKLWKLGRKQRINKSRNIFNLNIHEIKRNEKEAQEKCKQGEENRSKRKKKVDKDLSEKSSVSLLNYSSSFVLTIKRIFLIKIYSTFSQ